MHDETSGRCAIADITRRRSRGIFSPSENISAIREALHTESFWLCSKRGASNSDGWRDIMTLPSLWSPPVAADEDETKWSFLRQLILAIAAERQKKADEIVREYQQRQAEQQDQP